MKAHFPIILTKSFALVSVVSTNIHLAHATGSDVGLSNSLSGVGAGAHETTGDFGELSVPAHIDNYGDWFVKVSFPPSITEYNIKLGMSCVDSFPVPRPTETNGSISVSLGEFSWISHLVTGPVLEMMTSLSISPFGNLVKQVGSISLIRSPRDNTKGKLVLKSGIAEFNSTCVANSLIRLNYAIHSRGATARIKDTVARVYGLRYGGFFNPIYGGKITIVGVPSHAKLGSIPPPLWKMIHESILSFGAKQLQFLSYDKCPSTILDFLPEIEINGDPLGRLVLYPRQYMEFPTEGRCNLLLEDRRETPAENGPVWSSVIINPLMLKTMNIRISSDDVWELCEAKNEADSSSIVDPLPTNLVSDSESLLNIAPLTGSVVSHHEEPGTGSDSFRRAIDATLQWLSEVPDIFDAGL